MGETRKAIQGSISQAQLINYHWSPVFKWSEDPEPENANPLEVVWSHQLALGKVDVSQYLRDDTIVPSTLFRPQRDIWEVGEEDQSHRAGYDQIFQIYAGLFGFLQKLPEYAEEVKIISAEQWGSSIDRKEHGIVVQKWNFSEFAQQTFPESSKIPPHSQRLLQ